MALHSSNSSTHWPKTNWHQRNHAQHWLKHSILPLVLLVAFLWLPKPWTYDFSKAESIIEIDLSNEQIPEPIEPELAKPEPSELKTIAPKNTETTSNIKPQPKASPAPKASSKLQELNFSAPALSNPALSAPKAIIQPEVNAGDVLKMLNNRQSVEIPTEFQARTEPAKDFYIPEQEIEDWLADIPFLDETVDKPNIQMRFYAEGFEGNIEKFFDKITISKTFTTKYGTKIHCALVGILAACSWK